MVTPRDNALILVADDNPVNLEVLSTALSAQGFEVLVASDGEMVLEQVRYETPDLILLDAVMPGIDGFEACKRLKDDSATRDIPIIFMTALTDSAHKLQGLRLGAVDYLIKPFEQEEVLLRVKTHLALQRMTRALRAQNAELERQISERAAIEAEQAALTRELERRTEELSRAKEQLERELSERLRAEEARAGLAAQIIEVQAERLQELSTPLIPITDWLAVMPLLGVIDRARAEQALETALRGASERGVEVVIFDVTGVKRVDAEVAETLLRTASALGLLGTRTVITGIRFEVARTLAALDVDTRAVATCDTLQNGIARALVERRAVLGFSQRSARRNREAP
jgi:DNA-binding response OmpR family regulator